MKEGERKKRENEDRKRLMLFIFEDTSGFGLRYHDVVLMKS